MRGGRLEMGWVPYCAVEVLFMNQPEPFLSVALFFFYPYSYVFVKKMKISTNKS